MKERNNNQSEIIRLPPAWCGAICRNAMNEVCIEQCAPNRDCSGFEEKPNLKLTDMPRFPKTDGMSREEKFTSVTVYLSKVVDHLQGVENEQTLINGNFRREHIPGMTIPTGQHIESVLSGVTDAISLQPNEPQGKNQVVRTVPRGKSRIVKGDK